MLDNFTQIEFESPADRIIRQIRALITSGQLVSGDKLPSERMLAEKFGTGRSHVRDAIRKLEIYGILRTHPQSGTVVEGLGIAALDGLISNIIKIDEPGFKSLVETRVMLEMNAAGLAAQRRTSKDLDILEKTLQAYEDKLIAENIAIEEDLMFHVKIAEASKNKVLQSLMMIITPDIIKSYSQLNICDNDVITRTIEDHRIILTHIKNKDATAVQQAMKFHLKDVVEYSLKIGK